MREHVRHATEVLRVAGVPSPEHDAWALLEHATGMTRAELLARADGVDLPSVESFESLVLRRACREPLQHLTGRAYFRHLTLAVGRGVFVPRPETEVVVDAAIAAVRDLAAPRVVDLGTGSGAIALAIATEVPAARVHAVEADPAAFAWARRNCAGSSVDLRHGDMAAAFPDLDGSVVVEHADVQGASAPAVFSGPRWAEVADHPDLAGRDRYLTAARTAAP